jgi:hypothetical protein
VVGGWVDEEEDVCVLGSGVGGGGEGTNTHKHTRTNPSHHLHTLTPRPIHPPIPLTHAHEQPNALVLGGLVPLTLPLRPLQERRVVPHVAPQLGTLARGLLKK